MTTRYILVEWIGYWSPCGYPDYPGRSYLNEATAKRAYWCSRGFSEARYAWQLANNDTDWWDGWIDGEPPTPWGYDNPPADFSLPPTVRIVPLQLEDPK